MNLELVAGEDLARRIVRRVDDDGLRLRAERARSSSRSKLQSGGMQLHEARRRAGENRVGPVVFVERLEDDDFVAGIDDAPAASRSWPRSRRRSDGDLALGIDAHALRALDFPAMASRNSCAPQVMAY